jgi:hypothetical protein
MRMPLDGGTPIAIATGQTHPKFIAVDESNAYFTNDSTVMSVPLDGGPPVVLASGQISATGIAVDAANVYWTNLYGGSVRKVPRDGGRLGTLAVNQSAPFAIATNGSIACWTNTGNFGSVVSVALDGGVPITLEGAASDYNPAGIAVDDTNIFWAQSSYLGPVYRVAIDGGASSVLATENGPYLLALDESTVYFSVPNGGPANTGAIEKVPKDGGASVILATTTLGQYPGPIAVDQTSVYWVNSGDGSIVRVTPK